MSERKIENELVIDADIQTVWRALTEGEELKRWFPLDARVTPGEGGKVWLSWGGGMDWESDILVWDQPRHLRTGDATQTAVDYYLESRGNQTVLRLVHSGFAADTWEGEIESLEAGWMALLATLRHYVERHAGKPRTVAHFRHPSIAITAQEAFVRALHGLGFTAEQPPVAGERYEATAESGDRFAGRIVSVNAPLTMSATVETMSDAFLMLEIERGRESVRPAIWLSFYGDAGSEAAAVQERIEAMLRKLFA